MRSYVKGTMIPPMIPMVIVRVHLELGFLTITISHHKVQMVCYILKNTMQN